MYSGFSIETTSELSSPLKQVVGGKKSNNLQRKYKKICKGSKENSRLTRYGEMMCVYLRRYTDWRLPNTSGKRDIFGSHGIIPQYPFSCFSIVVPCYEYFLTFYVSSCFRTQSLLSSQQFLNHFYKSNFCKRKSLVDLKMHSKSPKKVVVVGGGIAGALLAKNLQDHVNVTLIDPKEYFEIIWASLRSMVDLSFAERSLVNYSDFLSQVKLITSYATHITESEVLTARGDRVPYDYLVIATGHVYSDPVTRAEGLSKYQEELHKIKSSSSIMIIGGGPSGVELAGEIVNEFPDKKITLVHRGPRLLQFIGSKASQKALEWLTSKKVEVILNQSVDLTPTSEGVYQTSGGETIVADQYFSCTGSQSGSSWLKDTILMDNLDMKGKLVVDKHLRVEGHRSIFAIGDITNLPELKQGYLAMRHAELTAKNLRLLLGGGSEEKMTVYKPGRPIAFVSLGKKDAVAEINGFTMSGCFPGLIKSGDLFVGKTRKTYGLNS